MEEYMDFVAPLTHYIRDSETSIDFVQGPPGSRRERVNNAKSDQSKVIIWAKEIAITSYRIYTFL